ncbi:MAG: hypothetical protein ACI9KE_006451 [Polyangiales bacterium]|jgi:hypothetical protein
MIAHYTVSTVTSNTAKAPAKGVIESGVKQSGSALGEKKQKKT